MKRYVITEKMHANSIRKGRVVGAANLTAAKRRASREQMFRGTVMTVQNEFGKLLAIKQNGKWRDIE